MGGSAQKYLSIVGSEIKILKANEGVKEKGMCLKEKYMGSGAVGAGAASPPVFAKFVQNLPFCLKFWHFYAYSPLTFQLVRPHFQIHSAVYAINVRAVALSLHGILC